MLADWPEWPSRLEHGRLGAGLRGAIQGELQILLAAVLLVAAQSTIESCHSPSFSQSSLYQCYQACGTFAVSLHSKAMLYGFLRVVGLLKPATGTLMNQIFQPWFFLSHLRCSRSARDDDGNDTNVARHPVE